MDIPAPPRTNDLREPNTLVTLIPVMGIGVMALLYVLRAFDSSNNCYSALRIAAELPIRPIHAAWAARRRFMAVQLLCPNLNCRKVLAVPDDVRGKTVKCQHCATLFKVPEAKKTVANALGDHHNPAVRKAV